MLFWKKEHGNRAGFAELNVYLGTHKSGDRHTSDTQGVYIVVPQLESSSKPCSNSICIFTNIFPEHFGTMFQHLNVLKLRLPSYLA